MTARTTALAGTLSITLGLASLTASATGLAPHSKPDVPAVVIEIANPCRDAIQQAAQYRASTYSSAKNGRWQSEPVTIRRANPIGGGTAFCNGYVDMHRIGGRWDGAGLSLACTLNLRRGTTGRWVPQPQTLNCDEDFYPEGFDELPTGGGDFGPGSFPGGIGGGRF
jgi:hypothetical protein